MFEPLLTPEPLNPRRVIWSGYLLYNLLALTLGLLVGLCAGLWSPSLGLPVAILMTAALSVGGTYKMARVTRIIERCAEADARAKQEKLPYGE
jgi:hypothetical protein